MPYQCTAEQVHCWSWASANWESLDGTLDPLAIGASLAISLMAIAAGAQQAAVQGSSFTLADISSVAQVSPSLLVCLPVNTHQCVVSLEFCQSSCAAQLLAHQTS
jgi:hypothetical protein